MAAERYLPFPFGVAPNGTLQTTDLDGAIRGRIEQLLFTAPGERVMLPGFGCGARRPEGVYSACSGGGGSVRLNSCICA